MRITPNKIPARFVVVLASIAITIVASNAVAQPTNTALSKEELAIQKGKEAGALYDDHKWAEAFDAYKKADEINHFPKFVLFMARCKGKMGKLIEASNRYKGLIDKLSTPLNPTQFAETLGQAKEELESLQKRIPFIWVILTNGNSRDVRLTLDGWQQTVDKPIEVDPGEHTIVITYDKGQSYTRVVEVAEGKEELLTENLPPKALRFEPALIAPGLIMGVGGIALVGAFGTSIFAGKAWEPCSGSSCADDQAYARKLDAGATAAAVAGLLTLGVGATWLGMVHDSSRAPKSAQSHVLPIITPSGVFLTGTF